jgi:hypothetical protein
MTLTDAFALLGFAAVVVAFYTERAHPPLDVTAGWTETRLVAWAVAAVSYTVAIIGA